MTTQRVSAEIKRLLQHNIVGLTIVGAPSQSANLQEWQDSAGTVLTRVDSAGRFLTPELGVGGSNTGIAYSRFSSLSTDTTAVTMVIRGVASQTGDLTQWQNSASTVIARVTSDGRIFSNAGTGFFTTAPTMGVRPLTAATPGFTIQGVASQTANLQEWQNSSGTVLAQVEPNGHFRMQRLSTGPSGWFDVATLNVQAYSAAVMGIVVRGAASQTANLQEWQNSAGTVQARIGTLGEFVGSQIYVNTYNNSSTGNNSMLELLASGARIRTNIATNVALTVRNLATTPTANLQEWQDSAASVKLYVDASGALISLGTNLQVRDSTGNTTYATINSTGGHRLSSVSSSTVGLIVRGAASQSSNLQEWQDSTASNVAFVDPSGVIRGTAFRTLSASAMTATVAIVTASSSTIGVAVRGSASQTADLQQWQNSAGTSLVQIDSAGRIGVGIVPTSQFHAYSTTSALMQLQVHSDTTSDIPVYSFIRRSAAGSSTPSSSGIGSIRWEGINGSGTYQQFAQIQVQSGTQNATATPGLMLFLTKPSGVAGAALERMRINGDGLIGIGTNNPTGYMTIIANNTAANVGLAVRGAASQTGNLQEWQSSAGTILARVSSSGAAQFASIDGGSA